MVIAIAFIIIFLDQLSKWWAAEQEWVTLNYGVSFGLLENNSVMGAVVLTLISLAILYWIFKCFPQASNPVKGLLAGGALSNTIDRWLPGGGVRDWLPIPGTSLMNNLADYAIFGALIWLVLEYVVRSRQPELKSKHAD